MADFINTADIIGDNELCDQIISKAVSEYKENRITKIGNYAFHGCGDLIVVDTPNVKTIGDYAFAKCTVLADIPLTNVESIGDSAFYVCKALTQFVAPKIIELKGNVLRGCSAVTTLDCPEVTSVADGALNATGLSRLYLPKCTIMYGWNTCSGSPLEVVDLPAIETISMNYGFSGCSKLYAVILRGSTVCAMTTATVFKNDSGITKGTGYIYVPRSLVDSYKAATNWSTYADQFRALEDYTVDGTITGELDESKI